MKIILKVVGPSKFDGLHIAKGTADGKDFDGLVKQQGENAALVVFSRKETLVGNARVISFTGNTLSLEKGKVEAEAEFSFSDLRANMRPIPATAEAQINASQELAKAQEQNKQLVAVVEGYSKTLEELQAKAKPTKKTEE